MSFNFFIPLYSINVVGVWMRCVTLAQNTSYPFPTQHPNLKECVTPALTSYQLAIEVRMIATVYAPLRTNALYLYHQSIT